MKAWYENNISFICPVRRYNVINSITYHNYITTRYKRNKHYYNKYLKYQLI